jgi:hypothetical protein
MDLFVEPTENSEQKKKTKERKRKHTHENRDDSKVQNRPKKKRKKVDSSIWQSKMDDLKPQLRTVQKERNQIVEENARLYGQKIAIKHQLLDVKKRMALNSLSAKSVKKRISTLHAERDVYRSFRNLNLFMKTMIKRLPFPKEITKEIILPYMLEFELMDLNRHISYGPVLVKKEDSINNTITLHWKSTSRRKLQLFNRQKAVVVVCKPANVRWVFRTRDETLQVNQEHCWDVGRGYYRKVLDGEIHLQPTFNFQKLLQLKT